MDNLENYPKFTDDEYINCDKLLGRGTFGNVGLFKHAKTNKLYAIKEIQINENSKYKREIQVMASLKHPCLCEFISFQYVPNENKIKIVLPYYPNGSLDRFRVPQKNRVEWWNLTTKMKAFYGIAVGMAYMHSKKAIHRDLKPANVLLDENYEIKITDFGSSRFFDDYQSLTTLEVGTPIYQAPELIDCQQYDPKVDVYSYSITIYELLFERPSYTQTIVYKLMNAVANGKRPPIGEEKDFKYGKGLYNLIRNCWSPSVERRPSFDEIVQIFPSILPEGTDIDSFNEYALRINPDAFKPKKTSVVSIPREPKRSATEYAMPKQPFNVSTFEIDVEDLKNESKNESKNDSNNSDNSDNDNTSNFLKNSKSGSKNGLSKGSVNSSIESVHSSSFVTQLNANSLFGFSTISSAEVIKINAEAGNAKYMFEYGLILYCGDEQTAQDIPGAISYILQAADKRNPDAIFWVGMHYFEGTDGFSVNMKYARKMLKEAADNNKKLAQFLYGFVCEHGSQCYPAEINPQKATPEQRAKYEWAIDKKEGFYYTKMAADNGHRASALMIDRMYDKGVDPDESGFSIDQNDYLATKYFRMAADCGEVSSMVRFSKRASMGKGMDVNPALAVKYMKKAAELEDMHGMYNYGLFFFHGLYGFKKNVKEALYYIKKSADKGLSQARSFYANLLFVGYEGVEKNVELAIKYEPILAEVNK